MRHHKALSSICALLILCLFNSGQVQALSLEDFKHVPPVIDDSSNVEQVALRVPENGISKIRVFVQAESGYRLLPMRRENADFVANLAFEDLAELTYHFQIATIDGKIFESAEYIVRKHSGAEFEQEIAQKMLDLEKLKGEVLQLENTIQGLRAADPKTYARQKNVELARAVVLLSRRERQVREAEAALRDGHEGGAD